MTNRLAEFRSRLAHLRRVRGMVRAGTAWAALASSLLLALALVFVVDWLFDLSPVQRVVVLILAAAGLVWSFRRFTWPLLGWRESEIEMALLVERQERIDSDLVAALQFEQQEASGWGSPELRTVVIERTVQVISPIDVFAGLSREQLLRRAALLSAIVSVFVAACVLWPAHATAFLNRLLLGSRHYPTQTRIEQVVVNGRLVLLRQKQGGRPSDSKAPQGQPLKFFVQCTSRLPREGHIDLTASGNNGLRHRLELKPLTLDERLQRLRTALDQLVGWDKVAENRGGPPPAEGSARSSEQVDFSSIKRSTAHQGPGWLVPPYREREELLALLRFDAPTASRLLTAAKAAADLTAVKEQLEKTIAAWPAEAKRSVVLAGELTNLGSDVSYRIAAGDAWTDPANIEMIALPIVTLKLGVQPPKYAAAERMPVAPSDRQFAVLELSSVALSLECTNHKPLKAVSLLLESSGQNQRLELSPNNAERLSWSLPAGNPALANIRHEVRYEVLVIDDDDLSPLTPIRGTIRIRPDQPPTGLAETVHRVVLPGAEPAITYRASDDFGVSQIALLVDVERAAANGAASAETTETPVPANDAPAPPSAVKAETRRYEILSATQPLKSDQLPLTGRYSVPLSPLNLVKGDRLKLTLEVTDYRGENEQGQSSGQTAQADPLVLEISDEAGVLAAISETDKRSEEQLSDIIKRQLGIGEEK